MGQTAATATAKKTQPVNDSDGLRLQLKEDGKFYYNNENSDEARKRLLHTLQTNDCREIITAVVNGDDLANVFVLGGGQNHVDILEAFLNNGMNVDIKDKNGETALMNASYYEHEECVRLLLDRHASVDAQKKNGYTALMFAGHRGNTKIVEMLLQKNANPNLQNNSGTTALMHASMRGHKDVVQLLLNHGVDIDLKNKSEKTAVEFADDEEIKEMLLTHVNTSYVLK